MYNNRETNSPKIRFGNSSCHKYQSPAKSNKIYSFKAEQKKTSSLSPSKNMTQTKPQNSCHIKSVEKSSASQMMRNDKIFQKSPGVNRESKSKQRRRIHSIFGKYNKNLRQKSIQREFKTKKTQTQRIQVKKQTVEIPQSAQKTNKNNQSLQYMSISQLNQFIDRRLVEKISIFESRRRATSMSDLVGNDQILKKEQQNIFLKLQVQRLKRCEKLNKQNQILYKKLVIKLKQHSKKQKSMVTLSPPRKKQIQTSSKKNQQKQTPISSLCDLKRADPQEKQAADAKHRQNYFNESFSPNKIILSPQELFMKEGQSSTKQDEMLDTNSQPMTFNNTKQIHKQKTHSKRIKVQTVPNMQQLKQLILRDELSKQTVTQFPGQNRLLQINNQLQRKMSYRSISKNKHETVTSSSLYPSKPLVYSRQHINYQMYSY